ncbi:hypothetical protein phytr_12700 [Candidatus Phycorickettsia trachydisci]|uniref:Uncharacterized protein n=1 Tax=Candidatus Phycorickettsia trachydisci TaxID=2115978 RepID=A0A2P1PA87_9RICK|nr:hypothetical protein [Candidatus Phycorickettsia trachydisci]AVP88194.1 hypothetical protein phytr_12700 [Candidatus Phycorickettsia trachydisci]
MQIFFISLPFDSLHSGDYDYSATLVNELKHKGIDAHYVTGQNLPEFDSKRTKSLIEILLESKNATEVFDLIKNIAKQTNTGFVIATHNLGLAEQSDKIFRLQDQELEQIG